MKSAVASFKLAAGVEPIAGYVLTERLGTGGYGEVWKADAPGGLAKAIKFVYGHLDEQRASCELKSLNRMKNVRHPFLLSLERVEVTDGHLIIVTELADHSVKERFAECCQQGLRGIPRDELIGYLSDAADALDYISQKYSLQHLDIKPENLLLLGGRVKVADFGMLKDLRDTSESLTGGLTPLYAPPELFEGRPNRHSDQYSLAIVFQEMLTGELPFGGRTAAQLAAQHLQSQPLLAALSRTDQAVVARALTKDPQKRFKDCRDLVQHLATSGREGVAAPSDTQIRALPQAKVPRSGAQRPDVHPAAGAAACKVRPATETLALNATFFSQTPAERILAEEQLPSAQRPALLPAINSAQQAAVFRPAVFVGLGGTAGLALRRLRRRLQDRFGDLEALPALQMLYVDCDLKAIRASTGPGGDGLPLRERDTFPVPLRPASEYRNLSKDLLRWMSRRWLYNIPRSLETEGMRPLGRLALITSAQRFLTRLREAFATAADPRSIAETADATGLDFAESQPRVYVVASISGGTGGGMLLDVAYACRKTLHDTGCGDSSDVFGILAHSTDRSATARDLAVANAYACLSELFHYSHGGNHFPGDEALELAREVGKNGTFRDAYLVQLGSELNDREYAAATDQLAEYLYLDAVTSAGRFFDACREAEHRESDAKYPELRLRTFGVHAVSDCNHEAPKLLVETLCAKLVSRWRGGDEELRRQKPLKLSQPVSLVEARNAARGSSETRLDQMVAAEIQRHGLALEPLAQMAYEAAQEELGCDTDTYFTQVAEQALAGSVDVERAHSSAEVATRVLDTIDAIIGTAQEDEDKEDQPFLPLEAVLAQRHSGAAARIGDAIRETLLALVDRGDFRVKGAQRGADRINEHLRELERQINGLIKNLRNECTLRRQALLESLTAENGRKHRKNEGVVDPRWLDYAGQRMHVTALRRAGHLVRSIQSQVTATSDRLNDLAKDLNHLSGQFTPSVNPVVAGVVQAGDSSGGPIPDETLQRLPDLVDQLEAEFTAEQLDGGLSQVFAQQIDIRHQFARPLRATARRLALRALQEDSLARATAAAATHGNEPSLLARSLAAAHPKLPHCGGGMRLLVALPDGIEDQAILKEVESLAGHEVNVVRDSGGGVTLCYEVEQMPLRQVAQTLISFRSDYVQVASRLHTRSDVEWTSL